MARKFLTSIDLVQNELQNARVQNLGTAPSTPVKGQLYMNSSDNIMYFWDGTAWIATKSGAPSGAAGGDLTGSYPNPTIGTGKVTSTHILDGTITDTDIATANKDGAFNVPSLRTLGTVVGQTSFGQSSGNGSALTVSRSDHTHGTPTHDATAHNSIPLSSLATPVSDINMGGYKILVMGAPSSTSDAATKGYVDSVAQGLQVKNAVRVASTANITNLLSAPTGPIDGITMANGDRILVKNQSTGSENGIYLWNSAGCTRAGDMDSGLEVLGAFCFVQQGTTQADTGWVCTNDAPFTMGSTAMTWTQFSGAGSFVDGAGLLKTGNTLDVQVDNSTIEINADLLRLKDLGITDVKVAANTLTDRSVAVANKDGIAGVASMRTLGTGATQAAAGNHTHAPTSLKFAVNCAAATSTTVTHNFGTRDVAVNVYRTTTPWDAVECDIEMTDTNNVTVRFATAPAAGDYRIVVMG